MTFYKESADASFYYRENTAAAAGFARMDSSAVQGNLADTMKNATILLPPPKIIKTVMIGSPLKDDETS